jgi:biotin carboxylase
MNPYILFIESSNTGAGQTCALSAHVSGYKTALFARDPSIYIESILNNMDTVVICDTNNYATLECCAEKFIRDNEFAAIMTTNDFYVSQAAQLCQRFVKRGIGVDAAQASQNKRVLREALDVSGYGHLNPQFKRVLIDQLKNEKLPYPFVLKPVDANDSVGVMVIRNDQDLEAYCSWASQQEKDVTGQEYCKEFLAEQYVEGSEFSVEILACGLGRYSVLAIFSKELWQAPQAPFVKIGAAVPYLGENKKEIEDNCLKAIEAIKAEYGVFNIDCRIDQNGKLKVLEVNGRIVGDQMGSHVIPLASNINISALAISVLTEEHFSCPSYKFHRAVGIYRIVAEKNGIFEGLDNIDQIKSYDYLLEFEILKKPGSIVNVSYSNQDVVGSVMVAGNDDADALRKAKYLASMVSVRIRQS